MFAYDPALLEAVRTAPQDIGGVVRILQTIDAICQDTDGLKWFNWLYLQVTLAVETRVSAGGFTDAAWLAELDVQFAALYFSALRSALSGGKTVGCWRVLFESRNQPMVARIQFAMAGVNAHINRDLAAAIVATCHIMGTAPERDATNYNDYTALNSTLDGLVMTARNTMQVRLPGDALPPVSNLEQTLAAWNVAAAREAAWQNSEHLWQLRASPILTASFMDMLDGLTTVIGKTLLAPIP